MTITSVKARDENEEKVKINLNSYKILGLIWQIMS